MWVSVERDVNSCRPAELVNDGLRLTWSYVAYPFKDRIWPLLYAGEEQMF